MFVRARSSWSLKALCAALLCAFSCAPCEPPADPDGGRPDGGGQTGDGGQINSGLFVYGRVLAAADDQPLAMANVSTAGASTETDADGRFRLEVPTVGSHDLTATREGYTYAQRRAEVGADGLAAVRDMYLTRIDSMPILIGPEGGRGANSNGSIELVVPAGALGETTDMRATWFDQGRHLPNDLPDLSHFTYACELTPDGQTFDHPVTVRMRNTRGFAPGTPIPVGVYSSTTLEWTHESMGAVTSDGEWVEYQVEHFSSRDCNLGRTSPDGSGDPGDAEDTTAEDRADRNNQHCGSVPAGSRVDVGDGHLLVDHLAPSYTTVGRRRTVALQYNSPVPRGILLEVSYDISQTRTLLPAQQRLIVEIGGHRVERTYEPIEGPATFTYRWDGRDPMGVELPPGNYPYTMTLVNEYATTFATVSAFGEPAVGDTGVLADEYVGMESVFTGSVALREETETADSGPYGSGWGLVGLYSLEVSEGVASIIGGDGSSFVFTLEADGSYSAGRGDSARLVRNADDTHTWTQPMGAAVTFDASGAQASLSDRNGNTTSFTYSDGRLTGITDPVGRVTALTYDQRGKLSELSDPSGRRTLFTIDDNGDLTRIENPDTSVRGFTYDAAHHMTAQTDAGGQATMYTYDDVGSVVRVDRADGTHTEHVAAIAGQASYVDPAGERYLFAVNLFGTRTAITDPLGRTTLMVRDRQDQITALITASGRRSDYGYDDDGNLVTISGFGRSAIWPDPFTITYDPDLMLPTLVEDNLGGRWRATYDAAGNVTEANLPGGRRYTCTYDERGQRTSLTIGGETTLMTYDDHGNLETLTDGAGGTWLYTYDDHGNINSVADGDGRYWQLSYNVMNQLEQVTNALGETKSFSYTPALGSLDIDLNGAVALMSSVTDGRGNTTTYIYDEMYRPISIADHLGNTTRYAYDANGRLISREEPNGATVSYIYNRAGQLTQRTPSVGEPSTYTYDPETGLCTHMETPTCQLDLSYDWFELVSSVVTTFASSATAATISYAYRTSYYGETLITLERGASVTDFGFGWGSSDGWLPESVYGGASIWLYPEYDAVGRPAGWYDSNSGTQADYTYDGAGRMTSASITGSVGSTAASWEYSLAGYRTRTTHPDGDHTYTYDDAGRLTEATHPTPDNPTERYTYDAAGNRYVAGLEAEFNYDAANRLTRDPTFDYTYDEAGNLTQRVARATGDTTTYTYDAEHRLIGVGLPGGGAVSFAYDPLGRRCEKHAGGEVTNYVYERDQVLAELDGTGGLRRQYVHGPQLDMFEVLKEGGSSSYDDHIYARDPLGTVLGVTDMYGTGQVAYRYQAFGEPVHSAGALGDGRMFAGREYDAETGLYHYRRRHYDPTTGRFLQRDPLPVSWALSPYAYAGNNPVNARDPYGLTPPSEGPTAGGFANQWVVQPGINMAVSEGLGRVGGLVSSAPFPISPAAGAFTVAGTAYGQYYGSDGLPSWADVVSVYGADNPAEAGIDWYSSQSWNPAGGMVETVLTFDGHLPRREARIGGVCGLREGILSFFGY